MIDLNLALIVFTIAITTPAVLIILEMSREKSK